VSAVEHFAYVAAQRQLTKELDTFRAGHMVFLIGPSGAGKTTLRHSVMQKMVGDPLHWGRGRIPAIETFAMLPHNAFFSSRELAKSFVEELHVPTLDWLFAGNDDIEKATEEQIRANIAECSTVWNQLRPHTATEGDYWKTFRDSLAARSCKYVSLDQVTALLKNRRDTSPTDHIEHLMTLAEVAGVMFIMTGIHTAASLWEIHSELRRRVHLVWMPPYSHKRKIDEPHYLRLLKTLGARYRLSRHDLLYTMADDVMAASGGVFAEIVGLLERAQLRAQEEGEARIKKRHVQASYYNERDLASLWRDIDAFEQIMEPGDVSARAAMVATRWKATSPGPTELR
jgi:ABC-type cobalamin/Fe3+-siderophores transport system ATPase subunit